MWKYKDILSKTGTWDNLFLQFDKYLDTLGLIVNEGKIIDASFVIAPRQRNTREENKKIKEGHGDELWPDKPHKRSHKDVDARWVKKRGETHFGYKDHVVICQKTKFVRAKANIANARAEARLTWIMPSASNVTEGNIAMTNLVYNMCRLVQIKKYHADWTIVS